MSHSLRTLSSLIALSMLLLSPASWAVGPQSDDFSAAGLNTSLWTVIDPLGDSTVSMDGTRLNISVPAGVSHDIWSSGNFAPHVMQAIDNSDFEVETKFESGLTLQYQLQGILVQQDASNFIRADFYTDGANNNLFVATFANGSPTVVSSTVVSSADIQYLRVTRSGNQWTVAYSLDGINWTVTTSFSYTLTTSAIGVFAGNAGSNPPAHTAIIDYFFNTASPISPEDGGGSADTTPPVISGVTTTPGTTQIQVDWATDEPATSSVEYGLTTSYELGRIDDLTLTSAHSALLSGLQSSTTYNLRVISQDASGNSSASGNFAVTTGTSSVPQEPVITLWDGNDVRFGDIGVPQRWVNILGKAQDPDGIQSLSYTLNGSASRALSVGPLSSSRVSNDGDFNIDLATSDLSEGNNVVVITAVDTQGFTSQASVNVNFTSTNVWPRTYSIDWGTVTNISDVAQVVDGSWQLQGGTVRTLEPGYDRLINIGDMNAWDSYEVTVPVTIFGVDPYEFEPAVGLLMRWDGHYNWFNDQPYRGWWPMGALAWYQYRPGGVQGADRLGMIGGSDGTEIAQDLSGKKLAIGTTYIFKMQAQAVEGQGSWYRLKVWEQGTAEPANWDLEAQQGAGDTQTGSMLLLTHHVDASFGTVNVVPLTPATSTQPPVISNVLASSVGADTATISWTTDVPSNSRVDYGTTTAYGQTASDATFTTSHSITLTGLTAETLYNFQVTSTDSESRSTSSANQTFTTAAAGGTSPSGLSDNFDTASLDPKWSIVDPLGDSTISLTGTQLSLSVPSGTSHDIWSSGNDSVRVMQPAADVDFDLVVKFDSLPTLQYQLQGILVEQDAANFIRFDFYSDSANMNSFAATFSGGSPTVQNNTVISGSTPLYMRVQRSGDIWTQSYSYDGSSWTTTASFSYAIAVGSVGVFAGNAEASPAFTALVDDFSFTDLSAPPPADVTPPVISSITVAVTSGTTADISWTTDEASTTQLDYGLTTGYELGTVIDTVLKTSHSVSLTGLTADTLHHFQVTAVDAGGNAAASTDQTFTPVDTPPVISNIQVSAIGTDTATISWSTDVLATSQVDYGLDTNYGTTLADGTLKTSHSMVLTGLSAETTYNFQVTSVNGNGTPASSANQTLTTTTGGGTTPTSGSSDNFDSTTLDPKWSVIDPLGDSTVSLTGTQLSLSVPSGTSHDIWSSGNDALRVMQSASDIDFELVVKFDSLPTLQYQLQGILVEQDASNFIRFDFYSDSANLNSFAATFSGGSPTVQNNTVIGGSTPLYLRVQRSGDVWTQSYSYDGSNWTTTTSFTYSIAVSSVGVFAGNAEASPAYTALVESFTMITANSTAPTAVDDAYTVNEGATLDVLAGQSVLANDTDNVLPDDLVAAVVSGPSNGALTGFATDGTFSYQPNPGFNGVDSFVYSATDAVSGETAQATASITVNAVGVAPVAADDTLTIAPDSPTILNLNATLLANDKDADGDLLTISSFTQPVNGSLVNNGDGTLTYTPDTSFTGNDSFTYVITDGALLSNTATVSVSVQLVNSAPQLVSATSLFSKQVIDSTVTQTHSVASADLDGDLDLDIVATDYAGDSVYWYENNGSGGFTKRTIDAALDGAYPVRVADLDGDGDVDVMATGYLGNTLAWYENDGLGNFVRRTIDTTAGGAHSVASADMDKDGDTDLLTTNQDAGTVTWYENDGTNTYTRRTIDSAASGAKQAEFADIDNDGDMDVVSASFFADQIAWYENDGNQNFTLRQIDTLSDGAYFVSPAYIDADGHIDILSASQLDGTFAWYRNDGFGNFTKNVIKNGSLGARTIIAEDVDKDGDTDAISTSADNDTITWYINDGNGNFTANTIDSLANGAYGSFTIDIDADGDIDVLSASRDDNTVAIHSQELSHAASLGSGTTLLIDSALLLTTDPDDAPAELTYTITAIPVSGQLMLNGVALTNGATLTQADINNGLFSYVHDGSASTTDSFAFTVADGGENGVGSLAGTFTLNIASAGYSDTFNSTSLDPKWSLVDPVGDGTLSLNGSQLALSVGAGVDHDLWNSGNDSLRLVQSVTDGDYVVEVKFDSIPSQAYQIQGVLAQQDFLNFIRFDFYSDGSNLHIFAATFTDGSPTVHGDVTLPAGSGPLYLRVTRTANTWTQEYSRDGNSWTTANSFSSALVLSTAGVYAGNAGGGSAPAFTALVDHFLMTAP